MNKRKLKKGLAVAMVASGLAVSVFPTTATINSGTESKMILWYDEPASSTNSSDTWQQATLPIGNGILGANVYGELDTEHLTLNEETLWSGGRKSVDDYNGGNPSSSRKKVYESLANYYLNGTGTSYNIEDLAGVSANDSGYHNGYQALGDLYIAFDNAPSSTPSDYARALDLNEGVSTVAYTCNNVTYNRTYFVSNPDNVIVSHLTASGSENLDLTISMTSQQGATATASVDSSNRGLIQCAGTVSNNGLLHDTQIMVVSDEGTVIAKDGSIKVTDANEVTIYLTAATDYKNTFYDEGKSTEYYYRTGETADELSERVKERVLAAANKGYDEVLEEHTKDYRDLYSRVNLDLGQENTKTTDALLDAYQGGKATDAEARYLEVLVYQYGRYLLIAGSRENSQLPTTLQGIWNNNNSAPWYSDIHTNINEEMNYWLSNNCNLTECALPLVNYMADLEIPGGRTVEKYTGCKYGIMAHTQNTPYGYTSPGWSISTWGWSPAAATWLLQNCYDYYEYSGDTTALRETIYPMLKEQILMYEELLKEHDGRMVMPITQSPELSTITAGNTYEQSLIWQLYSDTIEAAKILGVDSGSISDWQNTMDKLEPIEIGTSGQVKEWYTETSINSVNNTSSHRHLSNLLGLYPGNLFDTEEEISAAIVSLNNKNFGRVGTSNNPEGGWTYGQLINSWARVGSGENAYFSVKTMIQNRLYDNLWDWHTYGSNGAFQIDGNYGYSAGVGEMLLQSNLGYLNLLPAIPSEWAQGNVNGLLAEGGFEVDMSWTDGSLTNVSITSKNGGSCSVKNWTEGTMTVLDANGNKVDTTYENDICTFETSEGSTYTVKSAEAAELGVTTERNEDGTVTLNWNGQEGVTYTIKRRTIK